MNDLARWLDELGLGQYAAAFAHNDVDFDVLPHLSNQDLKELGLSLGHRKKLLTAIESLSTEATDRADAAADDSSIVRSSAQPEAERRQLTVMFCDLVGSTALSGHLDPEELREVIRAYQGVCTTAIKRYEGFVARYVGDGILAYFGYPLAHEDDAERALHAGLGVVEAVGELKETMGRNKGVDLAVRVGVATGLVVVGDLIGEGASEESAAIGETPNLAARLQGLAEPNAVVIAPNTRRLAAGRFEYTDLGTHKLKGIAGPVHAWRVIAASEVASRFDAAHEFGVTPLVGREHESGLLLERWEQVKKGEGQVVLLSGEPGIGKSRITETLREQVTADDPIRLRYQCSPYHTNSALYPIIDQLERAARFDRNDPPDAKLDKLEALLAQSAERVEEAAPLFAALLSISVGDRYPHVGLTPEQQKEKTLKVLVAQLRSLSRHQSVLMIFEDVHWADPTSLELLDMIVEQAPRVRVLALITFRPEFTPPWTGHTYITSLALNRLSRELSAAMLEKVTRGKELPEEVRDQIVAKSDGIPLFVEELTRTVVESGLLTEQAERYELSGPLPPLAIPTTLKDSLMARLDRLAPVKKVALAAAVIGREFGYELLAAVSGLKDNKLQEALEQLVNANLIFRRGTTPAAASYRFKHALVQNAAYESLLRSTRQQLHARIADALETHFPDIADTQPEVLAHHYTEAELTERAIGYWQRAGEHAAKRAAHVEAISHLSRGLGMLTTLADPLDRANREIALRLALAASMRVVDRYEEALEALERAEAVATDHGRTGDLSEIHYLRGNLYFPLGNIDGCLKEHELARKYAREASLPEYEARALSGLGDAYYMRGRMFTAHAHFKQCIELARVNSFEGIDIANQSMLALSRYYQNDLNAALNDGLRSIGAAAKIAHYRGEMTACIAVITILLDMGDVAGVNEYCQHALTLARRLEARRFEPFPLICLGKSLVSQGRQAEAIELMQEAISTSRETGMKFRGPSVLASLALATDEPTIRDQSLNEGEKILHDGCVGHNYFWFYRDAMEAALNDGAWERVDRYTSALAEYTRPEPLPWSDFFIARGRALADYGRGTRDDESLRTLQRLRDEAEHVGFRTALPALEKAVATG